MWMKAGLVLVVAALVASQSLRQFRGLSYNELRSQVVNENFIRELVECSSCKRTDCKKLVRAIMNEVSTLLSGHCPACTPEDRKLALNLSSEVQNFFPNEYLTLVENLSVGPISC